MGRVTHDFESRWHFNSAIALIMELTNEIYQAEPLEEAQPEIVKEVLQMLTLMLAPMTPHLAEELWETLGILRRPVECALASISHGTSGIGTR